MGTVLEIVQVIIYTHFPKIVEQRGLVRNSPLIAGDRLPLFLENRIVSFISKNCAIEDMNPGPYHEYSYCRR